ncbi:hypothetical protein ACFQZZ_33340 [Nocardia sp. GCM10030253]|uniref:hypothetical protein n=1 Tax=Nocardia sp. GCM10030253 TaxID=3273404 RepID=UPI003629B68D
MFESDAVTEVGQRGKPPVAGLPRAAQLDALRAQMAAIPGRVAAEATPPATTAADVLPIGGGLGELLPNGGLPRGAVVGCTGGGSVLLGLLAAATAAGESVAVLGNPRAGWLAFHEMGGRLDRLAHIPDPGPDPMAVAAVLLEGVPVVVLDMAGSAAPSRARAVVARVRSHGGVLIVTGPGWARADLELECRPAAYAGLGRGRGRLQAVHLEVRVSGRGTRPRTSRVTLAGALGGRTCWTRQTAPAAAATFPRTG